MEFSLNVNGANHQVWTSMAIRRCFGYCATC